MIDRPRTRGTSQPNARALWPTLGGFQKDPAEKAAAKRAAAENDMSESAVRERIRAGAAARGKAMPADDEVQRSQNSKPKARDTRSDSDRKRDQSKEFTGSGSARQAAEKVSGRKRQQDEAIDRMSGGTSSRTHYAAGKNR